MLQALLGSGLEGDTTGSVSRWTTPTTQTPPRHSPSPGGSTSPSSSTFSTRYSSCCEERRPTSPLSTSSTTPPSRSSPGSDPSLLAAATQPSAGCGTAWFTWPCTPTTSWPLQEQTISILSSDIQFDSKALFIRPQCWARDDLCC